MRDFLGNYENLFACRARHFQTYKRHRLLKLVPSEDQEICIVQGQ